MGLFEPVERALVDNGAGWELELRRYRNPSVPLRGRPVMMVPGYAMNTFILAYHPAGASIVEYLADAGREVWTCNLRGQGGARRVGAKKRYGMGELALDDLPIALSHALSHGETGRARMDVIGCSLGASLASAYLAHNPDDHRFGSMTSLGGLVRWDKVHPLLQVAFRSGRLAGAVPIRGTRSLGRAVLPVVKRVPPLLSIYMNAREVDLDQADQLVNTIDDPVPWINRQVARWVRERELVVRGVNVCRALSDIPDLPLLCVLANEDGIVPRKAALSIAEVWGTGAVEILEVGTPERWYAHADLFIGNSAEQEVFSPLVRWLDDVNELAA